jgi:Asp-tRNA(Asn)/Glu-tRNA(Gln) amidotransferase A subunit family amidase
LVTDLTALGVAELSKLLADRSVSAGEALQAHLAKIAEDGAPTFEGRPDAVNAWIRLYEEDAVAAAERADARLAEDAPATA